MSKPQETRPVRPRRSVLYMPGSNARALEKAADLPADALILDLEDAVAPDAKGEARERVFKMVSEGAYGKREVIIRINGLDTEWGDVDLSTAVKAKPDAILIPKINSGDDVRAAEKLMKKARAAADIQLWAMMETPLAMLQAQDIAAAAKDTRLTCFVMGTNDLMKDLHIRPTPMRLPLLHSLSVSLIAARAYGLDIIDGVYNAIKDQEGFVGACQQGVNFGFDGKTLIHPSQIAACNQVFTPDPKAVEWARKIIAEFEKPENEKKGVVSVDGQMVERLHAEEAKRLVALSDAIAELEAQS